MKKLILTITLMTSIFSQAQSHFFEVYLEKWENSKNYMLAVAEALPEEAYGFKPTEREMTFAVQLAHINQNINWLTTTYLVGETFEKVPFDDTLSKKELIAQLEASFNTTHTIIKSLSSADLETKVDFFAGEKTKLHILNLLQDHVTHHRGQLLVYLNLNNIKPPRYVGW